MHVCVPTKFKYIKECLKKWNIESFDHITQEKRKLEQQLEDIQTKTNRECYSKEEKNVKKTIMQELMQRKKTRRNIMAT